jgi:hypothetical protein
MSAQATTRADAVAGTVADDETSDRDESASCRYLALDATPMLLLYCLSSTSRLLRRTLFRQGSPTKI